MKMNRNKKAVRMRAFALRFESVSIDHPPLILKPSFYSFSSWLAMMTCARTELLPYKSCDQYRCSHALQQLGMGGIRYSPASICLTAPICDHPIAQYQGANKQAKVTSWQIISLSISCFKTARHHAAAYDRKLATSTRADRLRS